VLALDALRVLAKGGIDPYRRAIEDVLRETRAHPQAIDAALAAAARWLHDHDGAAREAGARGLALTLARTFAATLLARARDDGDEDADAALVLFVDHGLDRLAGKNAAHTSALLR